jgi:hypothetical protein
MGIMFGFTKLLWLIVPVMTAQPGQWGSFNGRVVAEWLSDGRRMMLVEDFGYRDPSAVVWEAPKNSIVDGASIPQPFWSFIGGPFEGKYRNASVVHDVACDKMSRPWQDVHRMFYNASRLGGVGPISAKIMYFAVYHWGPRWQKPPARLLKTDDDFLRGRAYIIQHPDITLTRIEELTSNFLADVIPRAPAPIRMAPNDK